ncbi:MAG: carbon-nitrogen hydrolase family protein [Bacteroidetes bacterium]|nr:carbon-nitrogen hydrolase family protein [Bacteroidota bacterium]
MTRIALAQLASNPKSIQENWEKHLAFINQAIEEKANAIFFPELSLSAYEPELVSRMKKELDGLPWNELKELSHQHSIMIGIGLPIFTSQGVQIGMRIFNTDGQEFTYAKQLLHEDELPYFIGGNEHLTLAIENHKIGIGICYESLQPQHIESVFAQNISMYLASVAKPQSAIERAYGIYSQTAKRFNTPVLLVNAVGKSDNFISCGQSAWWNPNGELQNNLSASEENLLLVHLP